jgi:hypothetical protein
LDENGAARLRLIVRRLDNWQQTLSVALTDAATRSLREPTRSDFARWRIYNQQSQDIETEYWRLFTAVLETEGYSGVYSSVGEVGRHVMDQNLAIFDIMLLLQFELLQDAYVIEVSPPNGNTYHWWNETLTRIRNEALDRAPVDLAISATVDPDRTSRLQALGQVASEERSLADARDRLDLAVNRAREAGASWNDIGTMVGTTANSAMRKWDAEAREKQTARRRSQLARLRRDDDAQLQQPGEDA